MATAQGIRAGRAFVELFADDTKLVRGLRMAEKKLKAFGNGVRWLGLKMAGLGTAVATPMVASGKVFGDFENQMKMVSTMLAEPEKYMDALAGASESSPSTSARAPMCWPRASMICCRPRLTRQARWMCSPWRRSRPWAA